MTAFPAPLWDVPACRVSADAVRTRPHPDHAHGGPAVNQADIYGGITADLNDGPVAATYGRDINGKPTAQLVIGAGARTLGISVTNAGPEAIAQLQEVVAELAAWTQRQTMLRGLPEVA